MSNIVPFESSEINVEDQSLKFVTYGVLDNHFYRYGLTYSSRHDLDKNVGIGFSGFLKVEIEANNNRPSKYLCVSMLSLCKTFVSVLRMRCDGLNDDGSQGNIQYAPRCLMGIMLHIGEQGLPLQSFSGTLTVRRGDGRLLPGGGRSGRGAVFIDLKTRCVTGELIPHKIPAIGPFPEDMEDALKRVNQMLVLNQQDSQLPGAPQAAFLPQAES